MRPDALLESCLYAADLEAAEQFYSGVLNLESIAKEPGRHVFFRCGTGVFLVFNPAATASTPGSVGGAPIPMHGSRGPGHLAFRVEEEALPAWRARLQATGVAIESEVAWPRGGHSIYFRDPAGNSLELATASVWGLE